MPLPLLIKPAPYRYHSNAMRSRGKTLSDLPESLRAFDIFIGAEEALQQGAGLARVEVLTVNPYTHIFTDPDSRNIAAIKACQKAGHRCSIFSELTVSELIDAGFANIQGAAKDFIGAEEAFYVRLEEESCGFDDPCARHFTMVNKGCSISTTGDAV